MVVPQRLPGPTGAGHRWMSGDGRETLGRAATASGPAGTQWTCGSGRKTVVPVRPIRPLLWISVASFRGDKTVFRHRPAAKAPAEAGNESKWYPDRRRQPNAAAVALSSARWLFRRHRCRFRTNGAEMAGGAGMGRQVIYGKRVSLWQMAASSIPQCLPKWWRLV